MTGENTAYYLYCLAPPEYALRIEEAGVSVRVCEGISAVFSQVSREEFCGEDADARLQDLAWLGPRACRHEAVIEHVMEQAPVLPARFATLFSSLDNLERFLLQHRETITGFFTALGGQKEWAIKGLLDRNLAGGRALANSARHNSPGTDYLRQKRTEMETKGELNQWLRATCQSAAGELQRYASAFRERKMWNAEDADVILNWAFLVPAASEAGFRQSLLKLDEQHSASGLNFVLSGPWPPYSFAPALGSEGSP
jgi:Gas vesicle synthesis protein GvpL/GvpF